MRETTTPRRLGYTAAMIRVRSLALLAPALLSLAASAAPKAPKAPLEGLWDTPGGRIELTRKGDKVVGVLTSPAEGLALAAGTQVLKGSFYEDNLTAQVRVGVLAPGCGDKKDEAFAMLLLTKKGRLTGGVSAKAACAKDVGSVQLQRSAEQDEAAKTAHLMAGAPAPAGAYDPRGQRAGKLPDSVTTLMKDAAAYLDEGQFEHARTQFQAAIAKDPTLGEAYNGVGATFYARNDFESAIDWYKRGLEASPGFGDLYYNLACAYAVSGKQPMALRYLKLAAAKGYTEVKALDEDPDFASLRDQPEFKEIRANMENPAPPLPAP